MHKDLPRPDLMKQARMEFHENSFTAGVLDGHNRTSSYPRLPSWNFAKTSTAPDKPREYYFQPGQYNVKWGIARPKLELKNIPFHQQPNRKPLMDHKVESVHLPDRSLSRPAAISLEGISSCPLLETRVKNVNFAKFTKRKPINDDTPPLYDTTDPRVVESVMQNHNSYDAFEAIKATKPRMASATDIKKHTTRLQDHKRSRSYGVDLNFTLQKTYLTQGPMSADTLPMDEMWNKPSLQKRIISTDLKTMPGREPSKQYVNLPPRGKVSDLETKMNFERGVRFGDSRADAKNLSRLAGGITELRGSRSYDALPRDDHPWPSVS